MQNTKWFALTLTNIKFCRALDGCIASHGHVRPKGRFQVSQALQHGLNDVDDGQFTTFRFAANVGKRAVVEVHGGRSGRRNVKYFPRI